MPQDKEFERVLQEAEDPKNIGKGFWDLPKNLTPSQLIKYELCEIRSSGG